MVQPDPLGRTPMFTLRELKPECANSPWTMLQLDAFMEMFLDGVGFGTIAKRLGRSLDGVKVLPWKLATRYIDYKPERRTDRSGNPVGPRDVLLLRTAAGSPDAVARGAGPAYLAALLGRSAVPPLPGAPPIHGLLD